MCEAYWSYVWLWKRLLTCKLVQKQCHITQKSAKTLIRKFRKVYFLLVNGSVSQLAAWPKDGETGRLVCPPAYDFEAKQLLARSSMTFSTTQFDKTILNHLQNLYDQCMDFPFMLAYFRQMVQLRRDQLMLLGCQVIDWLNFWLQLITGMIIYCDISKFRSTRYLLWRCR